MKKVCRLRAGSRIAIVSPSWGGPSKYPAIFDAGLENIRKMGLVPIEFPTARMDAEELRKYPRLRANDLHNVFLDPNIEVSSLPLEETTRFDY